MLKLVRSRKRLRLRGFDYASEGMYFITVCVHEKRCLLGSVMNDEVALNSLGGIVDRQLTRLPRRITGVSLDSRIVMPNHVHAIVGLSPRARQASPLRLGQVVAAFKSGSAREINRTRRTAGSAVWQRGYYDHIVRDEDDLEPLREYIATNPVRWRVNV